MVGESGLFVPEDIALVQNAGCGAVSSLAFRLDFMKSGFKITFCICDHKRILRSGQRNIELNHIWRICSESFLRDCIIEQH